MRARLDLHSLWLLACLGLCDCGAKSELIVPRLDATADACGANAMPSPDALVWHECEGSGGTICGTWTWDPARRVFDARWDNHAVATLTLVEDDECGLVIERSDYAGSSAGLTARYTGLPSGRSVSGPVVWHGAAGEVHGVWNASW